MIDAEKIVGDYLRTHAAVVDLIGRRTVGKTPSSTETPWVRLTLLNAPSLPSSPVDHLIAYLLQFDAYAGKQGGQPEANELAVTVRAALGEMPGVHDDTVVTAVRFTGMTRLPDVAFEPARDRVVLSANVYAHPA